jgi:hypothetical protein
MGKSENHLHLSNKNHDALLHLNKEQARFPEWIAIVAFYKAVQIVDAVCHESGLTPNGHRQRLDFLKRRPDWQPIFKHFNALWGASCVPRYLYDTATDQPYTQFADYTSPHDVVTQLVGKRLLRIEQIALQCLKSASLKSMLQQISPTDIQPPGPEPIPE